MTKQSDNTCLNKLIANQNTVLLDNATDVSVTYAAATTGKLATGTFKIADVTGVIAVQIFGVCGTNLAGATATLEVGTATSTAALIAQTTATDIDANEIWHDASPDATVELDSVITTKIVTEDINYVVGTADITAGEITFYIRWSPISEDGTLTLA